MTEQQIRNRIIGLKMERERKAYIKESTTKVNKEIAKWEKRLEKKLDEI